MTECVSRKRTFGQTGYYSGLGGCQPVISHDWLTIVQEGRHSKEEPKDTKRSSKSHLRPLCISRVTETATNPWQENLNQVDLINY